MGFNAREISSRADMVVCMGDPVAESRRPPFV